MYVPTREVQILSKTDQFKQNEGKDHPNAVTATWLLVSGGF